MTESLSTESAILVSIIGKKTPSLIRYILQCSSDGNKKPGVELFGTTETKSVLFLSAVQLQEAREHQSKVVTQALRRIAIIQDALNFTKHKLNELTKQKKIIESELGRLISRNP
jgi:hypothetical protein